MKKIKRIALFSLVVMLFISCLTIGQTQAANANEFNGVGTSFADGLDVATQKRLAEAPRTVEAWIKVPANLPSGQRIGVILGNYFDNYYDDISRFSFEVNQNSNPRVYWKSGLGNPIDYVATNVNVKTGDWMHLAITLDEVGNKAVTYVNGEKMHEEQFKVPLPKDRPAREMKIGSDYRGYTNGKPSMKFNGELADLRVWSDVRTAEEIKNNYNGYLQGDEASLMGNWKLANQIDGKYVDSSLEQNHVTLYNEETTNWLDGEFPEGDYSIAIIPDTQYLVRYHPEAYMKHINWIKENAEKLKIKLAIQVGDLVDEPNSTEQWGVSSTGMRMLDDVVPYVFSPGNHDMILGKSTLTRDTTKYNQFYPYSKYSAEPAFAGAYREGKMDNTYSKFNINGVRYLVLVMEFAPNDAVLAWADQVISENQDRKVIISTHSYMYHSGEQISTRHKDYPSKDIDDGNNGDDMWNKLVSKHKNIVLVTSGHIGYPDIVVREDIGEHGNTVQQVLADAQFMTSDLGMIMLMTFKEGSNNVDANWYSVTKEKFYRASNQFSMDLNLYDGSEPDPERTPIEFRTEDHSVKKGELVTVPITVSQASKMTGVEGVVQYDKELLTLESFEFVEFKENESHNASIAGKVSFAGIAQRAIGTDENTVIANLTFRAKADVTGEQETNISFFNVQAIEKGTAGQAVFVPTTAVGSKITLSGKAIRDLFDQKTFNIMVKHSSLNMDVDGGSYNNGAKIIQWSKGQGVNQQWTFIKTGPGYYKIVSQHSSKVLAVQNASMENGTTIVQQEYSEDESYYDEWSVLEIENGYYQLINRASGKVIGISNGSTGGGTSFTQSENISADYQKFFLSLDRRINHDWTGTGQNQLEYSSGWGSWDTHYSNRKDASVTLRFFGTQVKLYGAKGKDQGIVAISIDGGPETLVDAYASSRQDGQLLFESPTMTNKEHVLKIRVTGTKNEEATNTYYTLHYIDLFSRVDRLLESIAITTMDKEITTEGGTLQFEATVLPENAVNKDIIWSVFETDGNATDKATISTDGLLTAVKNGEVKVVATAAVGTAANSGSAVDKKIIVISGQKLVNSITVVSETGATEITTKGGSLQLKAEAEPANAANKSVTWSVYEADGTTVTTKATISESGVLTAMKDGEVNVVATAADGSGVFGSKIITISGQSDTPDPDPVKVETITVTSEGNATTITAKGGTLSMEATALPADAANKVVTWSVREADGTTVTTKATISESGVLTAMKDGEVNVVATAADGSGVFGSKIITISGQSTSGGGNGNGGGNNGGGNNGGSTTEPSVGDPTVYESKGSELTVNAADNTVKAQLDAEVFMKKVQAFEKAGENTGSVLSIKVSGSYAGYEIAIPAEVINRLANSKPDAVIKVNSSIGSYAWPVSELLGEGLDLNGQVIVRIEQADRAVQKGLEEKLAGSGTRIRGAVVSYGAKLKMKEATTELTPAGYVERTLNLDGVVSNPNEATVMKYDPVTGELRFVPAVFTLKDGNTVATIQHNENGLYVIVEGKKTFTDMQGHWAQADVEALASKLIINGMSDRTFAPAGQVTRAQFAALLVRGLGLSTESLTNMFVDVSTTAWYAQDVNTAAKLSLVQGVGEGKFSPDSRITREQMVVMIMNAIQLVQGDHRAAAQLRTPFADQASISGYATQAVTEAASQGLIKGKTETAFAPQDTATRAEAAVMIKQVLQYLKFMN